MRALLAAGWCLALTLAGCEPQRVESPGAARRPQPPRGVRPATNATAAVRNSGVPIGEPLQPRRGDAEAVTSAADIAHLLRLMASSQQLSAASREVLWECLASGAPPDALRETSPEGIDVLDKTGNLDDASNVGALLQSARGTVILVVLDRGVDPGDARGVIAQAGQVAYKALLHDAAEARR